MHPHHHHDHDHDHGQCRKTALDRVESACARLGLRMTAPRRTVLAALLHDHVPMTAYELIDRIAATDKRPSPVSVYRALDFLIANGFVHRIESRNAFVVCSHEHEAHGNGAIFLLCEDCGVAVEAEATDLLTRIDGVARASGFEVKSAVLELRGLCAACRAKGAALAHGLDHDADAAE
ncbi:Fur family transcriptional regulator [Methylobrevis pamukkalensis]|uniref:Zinc uptake regulation protein n=1 Tax=Methylobrevis pamukkalensis TaxID=1439726 RepID=A0A1E3H8J6_9HYPH|nr:Fur family transcriptional regulator [Methylobrevis pamukkalensis]ODN72633.1 Zinc uptake regulation protein [Methylobrevis pamukkalensis]